MPQPISNLLFPSDVSAPFCGDLLYKSRNNDGSSRGVATIILDPHEQESFVQALAAARQSFMLMLGRLEYAHEREIRGGNGILRSVARPASVEAGEDGDVGIEGHLLALSPIVVDSQAEKWKGEEPDVSTAPTVNGNGHAWAIPPQADEIDITRLPSNSSDLEEDCVLEKASMIYDTPLEIGAANWLERWSHIVLLLSWERSQVEVVEVNLRNAWFVQDRETGNSEYERASIFSLPEIKEMNIVSKDRDSIGTIGSSNRRASTDTNRCVMHPHGRRRLLWGIFGVFPQLFDLILIPMTVFDLGDTRGWLDNVALVFSIYWILDLFLNFIIGVDHPDGDVELRLAKIREIYFRTWFCPNVALIAVDFLVIYIETTGYGSDSKYLRSAKFFRMIRVARLVRLAKAGEMLKLIMLRMNSEYVLLVAKIAQFLLLILVINHYIACFWYAIALAKDKEPNWVGQYNVVEGSVSYQYSCALHWSLTQFAPATQNIAPQNQLERSFAICVVLFALTAFSTFVSGITNAVNQLFSHQRLAREGEARIREYVVERGLSKIAGSGMLKFFRENYKRHKIRISEKDLKFFALMPEVMRRRIHAELYMHCLLANTVLKNIIGYPQSLVIVGLYQSACHSAMSETTLMLHQDLFSPGQKAAHAYFVNRGWLMYRGPFEKVTTEVRVGDWVSENTLWSDWKTRGQLVAMSTTELVSLNAESFITIVYQIGEPVLTMFRKFSILYCGHMEVKLEQNAVIDDIGFEASEMEQLVERTFQFLKIKAIRSSYFNE